MCKTVMLSGAKHLYQNQPSNLDEVEILRSLRSLRMTVFLFLRKSRFLISLFL